MAQKRYYWLKLQRDFFKRHDMRIIEEMENGKDYLLFYLKLLVESIDHEGRLRFSDTVPYNEKMLSVVTNTNIDIVRAALTVFRELNLIEILEDETLFMNEVQRMIGSAKQDEHTRESTRMRVQAFRERSSQPQIEDKKRYSNVTCNGESESESESELEIEKDKEKEHKTPERCVIPPTIEMVSAYCSARKNGIDPNEFIDFYQSKGWMIGKSKMKDWQAAIRTWEKSRKASRRKDDMEGW